MCSQVGKNSIPYSVALLSYIYIYIGFNFSCVFFLRFVLHPILTKTNAF